ncbi:MAG: glycosyltransferase family 9 protein [Planctomycetota bacterium]|nr:glycosyltransferase family 9 protein [Planctomycetota bacterium]
MLISKLANKTEPKKILILRVGALGDLVFVLPAVTLLRKSFPKAEIHWLVKKSFLPFLDGLPGIHQLWPLTPNIPGIFKAGSLLRKQRFDLVLDFHGNLRSGILSRMTGAKDRIGFAPPYSKEWNHLFNNHLVNPENLESHKVDRNLFLVNALPWTTPIEKPAAELPVNSKLQAAIQNELAELGIFPGEKLIIIHSGASKRGAIKRWFPERFAKLVELLEKSIEAKYLLIWGSPDEQLEALKIQSLCPGVQVMPRQLPFGQLFELFRRATLLIGVDTGPLHLANALGTPVLALFGPKSRSIYKPYHGRAVALAKNDEVQCPPCNAARCNNSKGRVCMEALHAEEVAVAVLDLLAQSESPSLTVKEGEATVQSAD